MIKDYVDLKRNEKWKKCFRIYWDIKEKYNFSVIEWEDDEDWFLMDSLFKIIKIKPTSWAKKKKIFGLYLKEDIAFNS